MFSLILLCYLSGNEGAVNLGERRGGGVAGRKGGRGGCVQDALHERRVLFLNSLILYFLIYLNIKK